MKPFEIIFILLLMLPVALLMRYFVTRLSRETPRQSRTRLDDQKPSALRWFRNKRDNRRARTEASMQEIPEQKDRRRASESPVRNERSVRNSRPGNMRQTNYGEHTSSSRRTEGMRQADRVVRTPRSGYERSANRGNQQYRTRQTTQERPYANRPDRTRQTTQERSYANRQDRTRQTSRDRSYAGQYRRPGYTSPPPKHVVSGSSYPPDQGFVPRSHTALKRTQRIPFAEIMAQTEGKGMDPKASSKGTKAARSQQEPSKRQKRNIKKRSFRREQKRNQKNERE